MSLSITYLLFEVLFCHWYSWPQAHRLDLSPSTCISLLGTSFRSGMFLACISCLFTLDRKVSDILYLALNNYSLCATLSVWRILHDLFESLWHGNPFDRLYYKRTGTCMAQSVLILFKLVAINVALYELNVFSRMQFCSIPYARFPGRIFPRSAVHKSVYIFRLFSPSILWTNTKPHSHRHMFWFHSRMYDPIDSKRSQNCSLSTYYGSISSLYFIDCQGLVDQSLLSSQHLLTMAQYIVTLLIYILLLLLIAEYYSFLYQKMIGIYFKQFRCVLARIKTLYSQSCYAFSSLFNFYG